MTESQGHFIRFLIAGCINSATTYVAFVLLTPLIGHLAAYTLVYLAGIAFAYYLNTSFVFRAAASWRTALPFPMIYGVQYVWGLLLLFLLVDLLKWQASRAILIVIVTSVPLTFLLTRRLLAK